MNFIDCGNFWETQFVLIDYATNLCIVVDFTAYPRALSYVTPNHPLWRQSLTQRSRSAVDLRPRHWVPLGVGFLSWRAARSFFSEALAQLGAKCDERVVYTNSLPVYLPSKMAKWRVSAIDKIYIVRRLSKTNKVKRGTAETWRKTRKVIQLKNHTGELHTAKRLAEQSDKS